MKRDVPVRRAGQLLRVDPVGGDRHLAGVVEEVVEQDLRRQHRQERQERRRAGGAEHVAEVARRAHQDVLDGVGEDAASFDDAVGEHAEVLVQQDDVGGVLGDVGGGVDGDPDVGGVQGERVVDAVAEERDVARRRGAAPARSRAFCSGLTRAKTVVVAIAAPSASSSSASISAPVSAPDVEAEVAADLLGDRRIVAGDDLDGDAEAGQPVERLGGRRPWAGRGRPADPARRRSCSSSGLSAVEVGARAAGDGDDPAAGGELGVERLLGALSGTPAQRSRTLSGAPFVMSSRPRAGPSTSTVTRRVRGRTGSSATRR